MNSPVLLRSPILMPRSPLLHSLHPLPCTSLVCFPLSSLYSSALLTSCPNLLYSSPCIRYLALIAFASIYHLQHYCDQGSSCPNQHRKAKGEWKRKREGEREGEGEGKRASRGRRRAAEHAALLLSSAKPGGRREGRRGEGEEAAGGLQRADKAATPTAREGAPPSSRSKQGPKPLLRFFWIYLIFKFFLEFLIEVGNPVQLKIPKKITKKLLNSHDKPKKNQNRSQSPCFDREEGEGFPLGFTDTAAGTAMGTATSSTLQRPPTASSPSLSFPPSTLLWVPSSSIAAQRARLPFNGL